ncbi:INAR1 protein, partial [Sitta europaea]|nr:INAR1 protein [Sitta europaea]
ETPPHLPAPKNVEVFSYNFQSWLRWSPVLVENGSVSYTAQYKTGSLEVWSRLGCAHPQTQCPFPMELHMQNKCSCTKISPREAFPAWGLWGWVELEPPVPPGFPCSLCLFSATLGPPRVNNVSASPDSLLISVSPPFPPEPGDFLQYLVSYWENTTRPAEKELIEGNTLFQIGNLKESTLYCFSIRVQLRIYSGHFLQGEQRAPECHSTALS